MEKDGEKKESKMGTYYTVVALIIVLGVCAVTTVLLTEFGLDMVLLNILLALLISVGWFLASYVGKKKAQEKKQQPCPPNLALSPSSPSLSPSPSSASSSFSPSSFSSVVSSSAPPTSAPNPLISSFSSSSSSPPPSPREDSCASAPPEKYQKPVNMSPASELGNIPPPRKTTSPRSSYFYHILISDPQQDEKMFYLRANEKGHFDKSGAPLSKQDASFVYLIHRKPVNKPEALAEIIAIQSVQTQLFLSRPHFDKKATSTPKFKPHESINASSRKWKIYKNGFKDPAPFYLSANGELCIAKKEGAALTFKLIEIPENDVAMDWVPLRQKWALKQEKRTKKGVNLK